MRQTLILQRQDLNMQNKFSDTYCYYAMQSFSSHPHGRSRPCCFSKVHTTTYMDGTDLEKYPAYKKDLTNLIKLITLQIS